MGEVLRTAGYLAWTAKTPVLSGAALYASWNYHNDLLKTPWMTEQLKAAKAADDAYAAELLRAYKSTYPNDANVTRRELAEFEYTARNIDDRYLGANQEYQNDVYEGLKKLYGSQKGTLDELDIAAHTPNAGEMAEFGLHAIELASLVTLVFSAAFFIPKARSLARYGWW